MSNTTRLCSDFHLNHENVLKYDPLRWAKFPTIWDMNNRILEELKQKVKQDDELIFLWDLAFQSWKLAEPYVSQVPGKKKWVLWNHDWNEYINLRKYFFSVQRNLWIDYKWFRIRLNHFPPVSQRENYKVLPDVVYIHGHTHKPNWACNLYDISYNGWQLLYNLDDIVEDAMKHWMKQNKNLL